MIKTFKDKETRTVWHGNKSIKLPVNIQNVARRKLRMLNNSTNLIDLKIPPANRLEKLKGDLQGMYSIKINEKYRIIFRWETGNVYNVEIIDYHD